MPLKGLTSGIKPQNEQNSKFKLFVAVVVVVAAVVTVVVVVVVVVVVLNAGTVKPHRL